MEILKLPAGVLISMMGFCGMLFAYVDTSGTFGSRVPIVTFFLIISIIGIVISVLPRDFFDNTFGETQGNIS